LRRLASRPLAAALLVVACSALGGVVAQIASGASTAASAQGQAFTISGDGPGVLWPGQAATPIDLSFSNPNDDSVAVSGLSVTIGSISTPNASTRFPCPDTDFKVTPFGGSTFSIPPGTSTLQSLHFSQSSWPAVQLLETNQNQNGCLGATVTLRYAASGQDGPETTSTPGTTPPASTTATGGATTTTTTTTTTAPLTPPALGHLSLVMTPATQGIAVGGKAVFKLTVKNTAGVKLTGVIVRDPKAAACGRTLGTLAAGASRSYSCAHTKLKVAFVNRATVTGKTSAGSLVSASASAKVKVTAALAPAPRAGLKIVLKPKSQTRTTEIVVQKTLAGSKKKLIRESAKFKITVTNTGTVALHGIKVADARAHGCSRVLGALAAGASHSYNCTARSVKKGFTNVAVATGTTPTGGKVHAKSTAKVTVKTKTRTVVTITIPDVLFAFDKSTLRPGASHALQVVLKALTVDYPTGHITVTGYTDSKGSIAYNLGLSRARATTVTTWLQQHGIPAKRITIAWKGEADPIATNKTAAGRQKNRRVTVQVRTTSR
jgi:outer membrane protein OmpA-like peptidoglycan-associated protein